jgi:hypothetical protein
MGKLELKIRNAVHNKILRKNKNRKDVFVLNEFQILNGLSRIDIAVLNGYFHGYEIKSDKDNLLRLPKQVSNYNKIFDKMTLIVGYNHFYEAINIIPDWWGVKLYSEGLKGAIHFQEARRERKNTQIDKSQLSQLLLRTEMYEMLQSFRTQNNIRVKKKLAEEIASTFSSEQIRGKIKYYVNIRKNY